MYAIERHVRDARKKTIRSQKCCTAFWIDVCHHVLLETGPGRKRGVIERPSALNLDIARLDRVLGVVCPKALQRKSFLLQEVHVDYVEGVGGSRTEGWKKERRGTMGDWLNDGGKT